MRLFGFELDSSVNSDMTLAPKAGDGKLYKVVQTVAMLLIMIGVVIVVLEIFQILKLSPTVNGVIVSVGVVGVGGFVALPWVRVFESFRDRRYRITSVVFLAIVGVCVILWIVCAWLVIGIWQKGLSDGVTEEMLKGLLRSLNTIRISVIVSLQFIIASYIAKNIIKYGKKLLPHQIMAAASQLYIDFYFIVILTAISIKANEGLVFNSTATLLGNMWTHALLVIFLVLGIFPNIIFRRTDRRNLLAARAERNILGESPVEQSDEPDEKLQKIKELLDRGLITQEEYDKKRNDILNSI